MLQDKGKRIKVKGKKFIKYSGKDNGKEEKSLEQMSC